jgi:hypothetical protein
MIQKFRKLGAYQTSVPGTDLYISLDSSPNFRSSGMMHSPNLVLDFMASLPSNGSYR